MILSRSLERIRPLGPDGWGLPYVLDYKRGRIQPYLGTGEWDRTKDRRLWLLDQRGRGFSWRDLVMRGFSAFLTPTPLMVKQGGFGFLGNLNAGGPILGPTNAGTYSFNTTALNTDYVYGSAGAAVAGRFTMPAALTLDTNYFFITAYTGTAGDVDDITVEWRNDDTTNNKPNSTVHDSVVVDPNAATGWIAVAGFTFVTTANTTYWMSVADPDGSTGGSSATINRNYTATGAEQLDGFTRPGAATANGYSAFTLAALATAFVCKFSNGQVIGNPFTATANSGNTQNDRGLYISDGLAETISVYGFCSIVAGAGMTSVKLHQGAGALPDDAASASFAVPIFSAASEAGYTGTPYTVPRETPLSIVCDYGANSTSPTKRNIGTGADANLRAAMLGGGNWYWREQTNGGVNAWGNDDTSAWPRAAVLVQDQVKVSGGGGSNRVYGS